MKPSLRVVEPSFIEPPYPANTRARGFDFRLDTERLLQSDTWTICPPEIRGQLMLVWVLAWTRVPCGSWPDDDQVIAAAIGMPLAAFQVHRDVLMRGWRRHADGRLYHPVVTEQVHAVVAWREREASRKAAYRQQKEAESRGGNVPRDNHGTDAGQTPDSRGTPVGVRTPEPEPEPEPEQNQEPTISTVDSGVTSVDAHSAAKPDARPEKRGTRLRADWTPSPATQAWAEQYADALDLKGVLEQFRDFWTAKSGAGATKLDWDATYRVWTRNEAARARPARKARTKQSAIEERNRQVAANWRPPEEKP